MRERQSVLAYSVDRVTPVELLARRLDVRMGRRSLPIIEYICPRLIGSVPTKTILFLAGGGSSGLVMARVAELCAERGVQVVMFDLPGHTPEGLLGAQTPAASLVRHVSPKTRRCLIDFMLKRWLLRSGERPLDIAGHSAGFLDAGRLDIKLAEKVSRYYGLGASIPSLQTMKEIQKRSQEQGLASQIDWKTLWRYHALPTGQMPLHFGSKERFAVPAETLASYQTLEHIGVVLHLLRKRSFGLPKWRGRRVDIVISEGDQVVTPAYGEDSVRRFQAQGVQAQLHLVSGDLPHMFMMFEAAALQVSDILCSDEFEDENPDCQKKTQEQVNEYPT